MGEVVERSLNPRMPNPTALDYILLLTIDDVTTLKHEFAIALKWSEAKNPHNITPAAVTHGKALLSYQPTIMKAIADRRNLYLEAEARAHKVRNAGWDDAELSFNNWTSQDASSAIDAKQAQIDEANTKVQDALQSTSPKQMSEDSCGAQNPALKSEVVKWHDITRLCSFLLTLHSNVYQISARDLQRKASPFTAPLQWTS